MVGVSPFGAHPFTSSRMPLNVEDMWIDVGFHITEQGKVSDVQVLRSHGDTGWSKPLLASLGGPPLHAGAADRARQLSDRALHLHVGA